LPCLGKCAKIVLVAAMVKGGALRAPLKERDTSAAKRMGKAMSQIDNRLKTRRRRAESIVQATSARAPDAAKSPHKMPSGVLWCERGRRTSIERPQGRGMKRSCFLVSALCLVLVCTTQCTCMPTRDSVSIAPDSIPCTPVAAPVVSYPGWRSYTNANHIRAIAFDSVGNVWTAGGGVVKWDTSNNTYTKFLMENGLPSNGVSAIAIAPDDSLWIAGNGVSHFDGQTWVTYNEDDGLADNDVGVIDIAPNGDIWVGTWGGISRFDGRVWTTYSTKTDLYAGSRVLSLRVASDGSVLAGTFENGEFWISYFDGKTWTTYPSDYTHSIAIAPDGTAWLGTWSGIARFERGTGEIRTIRHLSGVQSLAVTSDNKLWFGVCAFPLRSNHSDGVWSFDGREWKIYTGNDFIGCGVSVIAVAPDDEVWLSTGKGLSRFEDRVWPTYYTEDNLAGNSMSYLAVGSDGSIWAIASGGTLASRFHNQAWTTYKIDFNVLPDVTRIGPLVPTFNGTAWYGSSNGVLYFDGQTWTKVGSEGEVDSISVAPDNTAWFATRGSISSFDGQTWTTYTCGNDLPCTHINSVVTSPDGAVWADDRDSGILHFDGEHWTNYTQDDGLPTNARFNIRVALDGTVWALPSGGNSLAQFDGQAWTTHVLPDSLANNYGVDMIVTPDGNVWLVSCIARELNLAHFDGQTWISYLYDETVRSGIISDVVTTPDGTIWIATLGDGVLYFDGKEWNALTTQDGLASNRVSSMVVAPDGTFWFSTDSGISQYSPPD